MSKKKHIILFILLLISIVFIYIKKIEIIDYFNGNEKELIFTIKKQQQEMDIEEHNRYYIFIENYNGDYKDLKKIYNYLVDYYYYNITNSLTDTNFDSQPYKSFWTSDEFLISDEGYVFEYNISEVGLNLSEPKIIIFNYISSNKDDLGLSELDFFYALDKLYILNKEDISVDNFTQWASFIANKNIGIEKNEKQIYDLYNKDKSQHITMNCYDFCRRFDFIIE